MHLEQAVLQLIAVDLSRFDEIDVARCVGELGGTMRGPLIYFRDDGRLAAAIDILTEKFGARNFARPPEVAQRT